MEYWLVPLLGNGVLASPDTPTATLSVCPSVLQHGPKADLGCRSNEFLDHAKT